MYCVVNVMLAMLALYPTLATRCATDSPCLDVDPITHQLVSSFHVACEDVPDSTVDWIVMSNKSSRARMECGLDWGEMIDGVCHLSPADVTGRENFWCECEAGLVAHAIFSIVYHTIQGADLYLICEVNNTSDLPYRFYKGNKMIEQGPRHFVIIRNFTIRHEGFYRCGVRGGRPSPGVWITLEDRESPLKTRDNVMIRSDTHDILHKYIVLTLVTIVVFYTLCMWTVLFVCACFYVTHRGRYTVVRAQAQV